MGATLYPPAGFPIRARDALVPIARSGAGEPAARLAESLSGRLDGARVTLAGSGREALVLLLREIAAGAPPGRRTVLIPAYGCYSIPSAVVAAGLEPRTVDLDPATLRIDRASLERADAREALALVAVHFLGRPESVPDLRAWTAERGIFLVDDAAQALGATLGGRPAGALGDAGILSFGRGKPLAALGGGAIVAANGALPGLEARAGGLAGGSPAFGVALETAGYAALADPFLFRLAERVPMLHVGRSVYDPRIRPTRMGGARAALALALLERLDAARAARRVRSARLEARLAGSPGISLPDALPGAEPAFLRFPFLAPDAASRDAAIRALRAAGFGAARLYPESLGRLLARVVPDAPAARCPGADAIADRLVTLPVHGGIPEDRIDRMADVLLSLLGGRAAAARPRARGEGPVRAA